MKKILDTDKTGVSIIAFGAYLPDSHIEEFRQRANSNIRRIVGGLMLTDAIPSITYHLYPDVETKLAETGEDANGHVDRETGDIFIVYNGTVKCDGPHELVHLLTKHLGYSNLVLGEGLAEYFEENWNGEESDGSRLRLPHDDWVRRFIADGSYIPICALFDDNEFWELDEEGMVSYPESASFFRYLVVTYGMERMLNLYSSFGRRAPEGVPYERFEEHLGISVEQAEIDWLNFLHCP